MTVPITGMYCDRCGARHDFERAKPGGVARLREFTRGVRGYVLNESPTFGDAMSDAWTRLEQDNAIEQDAEIHKTFSFCLDCRGYVCHDCWNADAGRCLTCVPLPGTEAAAEAAIAARLDLLVGPTTVEPAATARAALPPVAMPTPSVGITEPAPSPAVATVAAEAAEAAEAATATTATPAAAGPAAAVPVEDAAVVRADDLGGGPAAALADAVPGEVLGEPAIESVDAAARLAAIGMTPAAPAVAEAPEAVEPAAVGPAAATEPEAPAHVPSRDRGPTGRAADDDADVIAAAVAAGIIVPPAPAGLPGAAPPTAAVPTVPPAPEFAEPETRPAEATQPEAPAQAGQAVLTNEAAQEAEAAVAAEIDLAGPAAEPAVGAVEAAAVAEAQTIPGAVVAESLPIVPAWPSGAPALADVQQPVPPTAPETTAEPTLAAAAAAEPETTAEPTLAAGAAAEPALVHEPAVLEAEPTIATAPPEAAGPAVTRPRRGPDRRRPAPPARRLPVPVHCRHCGLQVPSVARFCRRCGGRQAEDVAVVG